MKKTFHDSQPVEFCPVAARDTSTLKWFPATYIWPHKGVPGWHLVREPAGNIVSVPLRRLRAARGATP